mmetsp:Transcript_84222/g.234949  ORF Transcript_84222/g.234949 Transcript_84222/m.234949 type:complete len:218 (-) Transcript_84222:286-939(-)
MEPSRSTPMPSTKNEFRACSSWSTGCPRRSVSPEEVLTNVPQRWKVWPFRELRVSMALCSFVRNASRTAGQAAQTRSAAACNSASNESERASSASRGMERGRKVQWLSTGLCFMLRSPAKITALPAALTRHMAARNASNQRILNGSRGPPAVLGTYALNTTNFPWSVSKHLPSPSKSGSPSGAQSARKTSPHRAKVATPLSPCRCAPKPSLHAQKLS